ncbi:rhodanese-like domain-containing protein [Demequina sp.]|uniref:rhodanese-like domain-containing protein n=1 Tax=Demequina sp. TaxID=2050685 RepID=UPI003D0B23CE
MTSPADAAAHFRAKLAFETDVSDAHAALEAKEPGVVLVDTRSLEAWEQGHARGAVHIPKPDMPSRIPAEFAADTQFVVYCWGPGCNGATRAGLIISELGYAVKEMIGGFEYWAREGLPVDKVVTDATGASVTVDATYPVDALTSPLPAAGQRIACDC